MDVAVFNGMEYRHKDGYIACCIDCVRGHVNVYMPYKDWITIQRSNALHRLSDAAQSLFPDLDATWKRAFVVKDGEEPYGHLLCSDNGAVMTFRPYMQLEDPAILDGFGLKKNGENHEKG